MMNVKEYAIDVSKDEKEILALCEKLGIDAKNSDDLLSEEDIILLDNELAKEEDSIDEEKEKLSRLKMVLSSILTKPAKYCQKEQSTLIMIHSRIAI